MHVSSNSTVTEKLLSMHIFKFFIVPFLTAITQYIAHFSFLESFMPFQDSSALGELNLIFCITPERKPLHVKQNTFIWYDVTLFNLQLKQTKILCKIYQGQKTIMIHPLCFLLPFTFSSRFGGESEKWLHLRGDITSQLCPMSFPHRLPVKSVLASCLFASHVSRPLSPSLSSDLSDIAVYHSID